MLYFENFVLYEVILVLNNFYCVIYLLYINKIFFKGRFFIFIKVKYLLFRFKDFFFNGMVFINKNFKDKCLKEIILIFISIMERRNID